MAGTMTRAQIRTLLLRQLAAAGPTVAMLLKYGLFSMYFGIPEPATLVVHWYQRHHGAKLGATAKVVLVASGRVRSEAAGAAIVKIRLTKAGRRLLKHGSRLSLTASVTLTPMHEPAISASVPPFLLSKR
jgi:hypothetical protein